MGRRHQKARKTSRVLRTNYGGSAGGGEGALVKGNPLRTSDPNQRPFFAVKLNKKQDKVKLCK